MAGTLTAVGCRGTYSVQKVGRVWWLQAVGHDDLPMCTMPQGQAFARLDSAQHYASRLDRAKAVEAQVSGV